MGRGWGWGLGASFWNEVIRAFWEIVSHWTWASGHLTRVILSVFIPHSLSPCLCSAGVGVRSQDGESGSLPRDSMGYSWSQMNTGNSLNIDAAAGAFDHWAWPLNSCPQLQSLPTLNSLIWMSNKAQHLLFTTQDNYTGPEVSLPPGHSFGIFSSSFFLYSSDEKASQVGVCAATWAPKCPRWNSVLGLFFVFFFYSKWS